MYYQYFGLNEPPFSIAVNPRYLFMSVRHRDALAHLLYGVGSGGGFILLTGEVGTGKTTINRCLLEQLPEDTDLAIILNPALDARELLATVCDELGIARSADVLSLKELTDSLHRYLLDNHGRGRKTVLMIDEAQHLSFEVLEQVRLLTNLETNSEKLLQIILIGQPELAQMLAQPQLRQLNQRITARYNLEALNRQETGAYIRHRLQVAGNVSGPELFPAAVVNGIYRRTGGIPRLINVLCDRMLLGAYGRNLRTVDRAMLDLATREVFGTAVNRSPRRPWFAVTATLMIILLFGWWLGYPRLTDRTQQAVAAVPASQFVENATAEEAGDQHPKAAIAETAAPPPAPADWLLPPPIALAALWSLVSAEPLPAQPCADKPQAGLACVETTADTWSELAQFDRPLMLDMVTPARFGAGLILLGVEDDIAWVLRDETLGRLTLAELGPLWTGGYRFFWRPPTDFHRPLNRGDRNDAVAVIAGLFARLDGQSKPLATTRFNTALEQRVKLYQDSEGLDADGVVGIQTLLRLNQRLGIDPSARALRRQFSSAEAGTQ